MSKEIGPRKAGSLLVKIVTAGAIGVLPNAAHAPVFADAGVDFLKENVATRTLEVSQGRDVLKLKDSPELSRNSQLSQLLEEDELRALVGASFFTALASLYLTYRRSKKYDDDILKGLKISASFLTLCSIVSVGVDSFTTIDRHIPAALFAGGLLIQAGTNLMDVYQREKRSDIRSSAFATSVGLVSIGLALLYAADRV